jgi:hypothetical protein
MPIRVLPIPSQPASGCFEQPELPTELPSILLLGRRALKILLCVSARLRTLRGSTSSLMEFFPRPTFERVTGFARGIGSTQTTQIPFGLAPFAQAALAPNPPIPT